MTRSNKNIARASLDSLQANVSTLKVHLGRYLRQVKLGAEVIVLDRQLPVAKLVPYRAEAEALDIVEPESNWEEAMRALKKNLKENPPTKLKHSPLYYLKLDREG